MQIEVVSKIKIIDCPCIIFEDEKSKTSSLVRNMVKPDSCENPITTVEEILRKIPKNDLLLMYKIADFKNTTEFLCNLAQAKGTTKKVISHNYLLLIILSTCLIFHNKQGGVPNLDLVAKMVIHDWNVGKIKYSTIPPNHVIFHLIQYTVV